MKVKLLIYLLIIILLQGCALQIGILNPNPVLKLSKSNKTIALLIDNNVDDSFLIPGYGGIKKSKVTGWHASLINGFKNGFNDYYRLVNAGDTADYILKLEKTELKLIPVSVSGYNNITVLNVEIKFKAVLLNSNNEILKEIEGVAKSEKTIKIKGEENEAIEDAIEKMYKLIAVKFFK